MRRFACLLITLILSCGCSPSDQFWKAPDLGTRYTSVEEAARQPETVRYLDLYDQKRTGLPPELVTLSRLERLTLRKNALGELPDTLVSLARLTWLDAGECGLTNLTAAIGTLPNLSHLYLNDNALPVLPGSITNLHTLQYLNLDRNQLTALPDALGRMESLRWLRLNRNQISALPADLSGWARTLKRLYLRDNPLSPTELNRIRQALPDCQVID
jgi:leucine-rich repeat protein SHOC2